MVGDQLKIAQAVNEWIKSIYASASSPIDNIRPYWALSNFVCRPIECEADVRDRVSDKNIWKLPVRFFKAEMAAHLISVTIATSKSITTPSLSVVIITIPTLT